MNFYYTDEKNPDGSFVRKRDKIPLEFGKCGTEGFQFNFENKTEIDLYGINGDFFCLKSPDYIL